MLKYQLLNIFYDHSHEIEWLTQRVEEEEKIQSNCSKKEYREWLKTKKDEFHQYCKKLKSTKTQQKTRTYEEIMDNMLDLLSIIEILWKRQIPVHYSEEDLDQDIRYATGNL